MLPKFDESVIKAMKERTCDTCRLIDSHPWHLKGCVDGPGQSHIERDRYIRSRNRKKSQRSTFRTREQNDWNDSKEVFLNEVRKSTRTFFF